MKHRLPLPTLLSHALVAFTIECDNEFEHFMPHRTTNHDSTPGSPDAPWLVSIVMWDNCMRFVGEQGVRVRELTTLARTSTNLNGMQRWGYVVVGPSPADTRAKRPRSDWLIRATPAGRRAQEIWRPLSGTIEKRWEARFGKDTVAKLRESLLALYPLIPSGLPGCLPILGYGLFSKIPDQNPATPAVRRGERKDQVSDLQLSALFSRVLLAFAIEFEKESKLSLAICANLLRVLSETGVSLPDLVHGSAVAKDLIKNLLGFLEKQSYVETVRASEGKGKVFRLTRKGLQAKESYYQRLALIETRWESHIGNDAIRKLRESLELIVVGESASRPSPLLSGLQPYPDGWRASARQIDALPHYPMITHRGGFPDGS